MKRFLLWCAVGVVVLFVLFPFYWALVSSVRTGSALTETSLWPSSISLSNYAAVWKEEGFVRSLLNSVIVAGTTSLVALVLSVLSSYSLSRVRFRGRILLLLTILSVSMFPQIAVLSGMFEVMRRLGLYNTLEGLVFCYMILVLPFTVWVLRSFMRGIPKELEEAAILDGCSPFRIVWKVFVPLMKPAIATTGILAFIAAWNEFLFALTFTLSAEKRTVPVAIGMLSGSSQYEIPWGNIMAAAVVVTVPLVVLVLIFQKQIVSGLTSGAVKG